MIYVVIGTKAQLIKMAPVMVAFNQKGMPYQYISTGQHRSTMDDILGNFGLRKPDKVLYDGPDITSVSQMAIWGIKLLWQSIWKRDTFPNHATDSIVLVHGDTFSTLIGALMGRLSGLKVGHVESGLRSFNLFHPFPEEITRILTFSLSDYYFCPGNWAVENLSKYRGIKINTHNNTLSDSLSLAMPEIDRINHVEIPTDKFAVATLHRYENVYNKDSLERVVSIVERISDVTQVLFILHKPTEKNLKKFGLYQRLSRNPNISLRPRYDYFGFIKLIRAAHFVVSDGGSNQEECYYLGMPVLLLRKSTERNEGLDRNCVLSGYDERIIENFLDNVEGHRVSGKRHSDSPSEIIANVCRPFIESVHR